MSRRSRLSALAAGVASSVAATLGAVAAEPVPAAPLVSESAAQLRTLKPENSGNREPVGEGRLRDALPAFAPPNPQGVDVPAPPSRPAEAGETKKAGAAGTGTNWLLDGYAEAGRKSATTRPRGSGLPATGSYVNPSGREAAATFPSLSVPPSVSRL